MHHSKLNLLVPIAVSMASLIGLYSDPALAAGYCDGAVKNGRLDGKQTCKFPSGLRYEGELMGGMRQGRGVVIYKDGTRCEGDRKSVV